VAGSGTSTYVEKKERRDRDQVEEVNDDEEVGVLQEAAIVEEESGTKP